MGVKWWGSAKDVILKGLRAYFSEARIPMELCESLCVAQGIGEKHQGEDKGAGLKPHTYNGAEKNCEGRSN